MQHVLHIDTMATDHTKSIKPFKRLHFAKPKVGTSERERVMHIDKNREQCKAERSGEKERRNKKIVFIYIYERERKKYHSLRSMLLFVSEKLIKICSRQ